MLCCALLYCVFPIHWSWPLKLFPMFDHNKYYCKEYTCLCLLVYSDRELLSRRVWPGSTWLVAAKLSSKTAVPIYISLCGMCASPWWHIFGKTRFYTDFQSFSIRWVQISISLSFLSGISLIFSETEQLTSLPVILFFCELGFIYFDHLSTRLSLVFQ